MISFILLTSAIAQGVQSPPASLLPAVQTWVFPDANSLNQLSHGLDWCQIAYECWKISITVLHCLPILPLGPVWTLALPHIVRGNGVMLDKLPHLCRFWIPHQVKFWNVPPDANLLWRSLMCHCLLVNFNLSWTLDCWEVNFFKTACFQPQWDSSVTKHHSQRFSLNLRAFPRVAPCREWLCALTSTGTTLISSPWTPKLNKGKATFPAP
jgi:hypothetical protein